MRAPCVHRLPLDRTAASLAGLSLAAALLLGCGSGCSSTYRVTLQCGPRINSAGLPESAKTGRVLRVALVCLSADDFQQLAQSESFKGIDPKSNQPWKEITAETWFGKKGEDLIRQTVSEPGAIAEINVGSGGDHPVKLTHPRPWGRQSGILVLADFYRTNELDKQLQYEPRVWLSTDGLFRPREFTVEIGETTIRRAGQ